MNREETTKLLKLISSVWMNCPDLTGDNISGWHMVFDDEDFGHALAAVKSLAKTKPVSERGSFAPSPPEIFEEMRRLKYPALGMTALEHKAQNSPMWRDAVRRDRRLVPKPYCAYADPRSALQAKDVPWIEKEILRSLEDELATLRILPEVEMLQRLPSANPEPTRALPVHEISREGGNTSRDLKARRNAAGGPTERKVDPAKTAAILAAAGFGPSVATPKSPEEIEAERYRQKELLKQLKSEAV